MILSKMCKKRNLKSLKSLLKTTNLAWLSPLSKYVLQAYCALAWICGGKIIHFTSWTYKGFFKNIFCISLKVFCKQTHLTKIYPWLKKLWSRNSTTCCSSQEAHSWKPSKLWNTSKLLLSLKVFQKLYDIIWMKIKYKFKQLLFFFIHFFLTLKPIIFKKMHGIQIWFRKCKMTRA